MKKILLAASLFLISQLTFAAELSSPKNINVKLTIDYNTDGRQSSMKNSVQLQPNNRWIILSSMQSQSRLKSPSQPTLHSTSQFLLLSKIEKADAKQATLKILVIDQNTKSNFVIEPTMIIKYDQKGEMKIHQNNRKIHITALARKE